MMIMSGGVDLFNTLAYAQPTQRDMDFFQRARENIMSSSWGQMAQQFYQNVKSGYDNFDLEKLTNYVNVAAKKIATLWDMDVIRPLTGIEEMQFANTKMIRWIMANPTVREFYHKGQCEGYGELYTDNAPGKSGENHIDWRIVMNGMERYDSEEECNVWTTFDEWFEDQSYSVDSLDLADKIDILRTWAFMDAEFAKMGEDPTSRHSAML